MKEQYMVISDFLYFQGVGGCVYADRCEIYKEFGLFLYKGDHLICHVKDKIREIRHIEISDTSAHHYIQGDGHTSYYLITKTSQVETHIHIDAQVVLKGNESLALTLAFSKDETLFERFGAEIEQQFYWTVIKKKEEIMLVIQNGEEQRYVSVEDVITPEKIKENAEFFKENLVRE